MRYVDGAIAVPEGPGLGVELERDMVGEYADLFKRLGGYPYDRDPMRPGWYAIAPGQEYRDRTGRRFGHLADACVIACSLVAFSSAGQGVRGGIRWILWDPSRTTFRFG